MANSGTKFVSVNLNKSYGQSSSHGNHQPFTPSYGQAAAGRGRPGSGGGGGGMVVLSRSRSSQKAGAKLSVPPPLNLPSLRKEHEKFDLSGSGGGSGSSAGPGGGQRPTSSGMGWSKPASVALQEKDGSVDMQVVEQSMDGGTKRNSSYIPPISRPGGVVGVVPNSARSFPSTVEKASVLRGEDFPSLRAALPVSSGSTQKQKDGLNQKQKHQVAEESASEQRDGYQTSTFIDMRPQGQSSSHTVMNASMKTVGENHILGNSRLDQARKQEEYFPGPLPLVRLNPRSDWADDERDTGHGFAGRGRDSKISNSENYWDRDFDMPRTSILPHKPVYNQHEGRGQRDNEIGKDFPSEVLKVDPHRRDVRTPIREGNDWRTTSYSKDQQAANDRNGVTARTGSLNREAWKENKHIPTHSGDTFMDSGLAGNKDSAFARREIVQVSEGRQHWNQPTDSFNGRGSLHNARDRYSTEHANRYRGDSVQYSNVSKSSFTSGRKANYIADSVADKRASSKSERLYYEDSFLKDFSSTTFDDSDLFSGGLLGVVKRKKDVKYIDSYDPVRESFEAELEKVQKMQDLERQRIVEEQERALEQTRREEEERLRLIREEEEQQQRLEEEAREAAWRAEQEQLEVIRIAEEQRIAKEEEKKRIFMEEERRKQAAKQKLLELEARIAQRQTETVKADAPVGTTVTTTVADDHSHTVVKEKDISDSAELDNWKESERMVERITTSSSFESSGSSRAFEMGSRPYIAREGSSNVPDRGKSVNSWRRDVFSNGSGSSLPLQDPELGQYGPRRDAMVGGRIVSRKEIYGGVGYMPPSKGYFKEWMQEPYLDEFGNQKDQQRWNLSGDADSFNRNRMVDSEFRDNFVEKYGDVGWGQGRYEGNSRSQAERLYPSTESDELYSYGRSRYSMRQPRVLPPPLTSMQKIPFRGTNEHPGSSACLDNAKHYSHASRSAITREAGFYGSQGERFESSNLVGDHQENIESKNQESNKKATPRCDSQSSLSVSSPPNSPPHLSHDELDGFGDSPIISSAVNEEKVLVCENESSVMNNAVKGTMITASTSSSVVEDDEWATENNDELQQQEEYDEDENCYQEEDEVREGNDENVDVNQEFEDLHLEEKDSSLMVDNLILGFDDGVEVKIPTDDFERNFRGDEKSFGVCESSVHVLEGEEPTKSVRGDEQYFQAIDGSSQSIDSFSRKCSESEMAKQESVIQSTSGHHTSVASDLLVGIDSSTSSEITSQQIVSSSVDTPSSSGQTTTSISSQADLPVKLQFGLFTGPSLIPSPVPSIQIGSIQMPLHLHPPVGPPLSHIHHPSQPPFFQFGQLRYSSPISPAILPMAPQSISFVQPNVQTQYNPSQNSGGPLPVQPVQDTSRQSATNENLASVSVSKNSAFEADPVIKRVNSNDLTKASTIGNKISLEQDSQAENRGHNGATVKNYLPSPKERVFRNQSQAIQGQNQPISSEKNFVGLRGQGPFSNSKGRRFAYAIKGSSMRSEFSAPDTSFSNSSGFQRRARRTVQRTEFRIRENGDKRQLSGAVSVNNSDLDKKSTPSGRPEGSFARNGIKRGNLSSKPLKQMTESENTVAANINSPKIDYGNRERKEIRKNTLTKGQDSTHSVEVNMKRDISEEDVDAPLQSGVVRVYKQPGIETPSDEDDFIQVRSKRQMLNDRREQREREIKAKSRVIKPPWKPRASRQSTTGSASLNKVYAPMDSGPRTASSGIDASEARRVASKEVSPAIAPVSSQPLAPIGTPSMNMEPQSDVKSHADKSRTAVSVLSSGKKDLGPSGMLETKNTAVDNVATSLTSWGTTRISQEVMALTQTQLEEAMKPVRFDTHIPSVGSHTSTVVEPTLPPSSIVMKDKSFSCSASPINSLLAGEKIQFGAVTSPTILPPSSRTISHGIGVPGSIRSDIEIPHNLSAADSALFFEKDKNTNESCVLQDCEAEAEAAASAVAVAAISSDDATGNGVGAVSDAKSFGSGEFNGATTGVAGDQQLSSQSRAEESLSVSLPVDLSVETPPISLWPPLPSPQNSSSQMLSHFHGGPPTHFPFYEMNPMVGGPIYAFGPHEESSAGTTSQSQKNAPSSSGPLSSWQHSTVDSFYGPAAGFSGPFISPPGGIPGVQGPPHMVVYNHFAPVGQFGQVGLSFMGTTYIPSGKQPDWKHNPTSSSMGMSEVDMNNMAYAQRSTSNTPAPIQHLAPGSPFMPMGSPLALFDVPSFQSAPDVSVQGRWSHVPASSIQSAPSSRPLHQQAEGILPMQFSHGHAVDESLNANKFPESQTSATSCSGPSFSVAADSVVTPYPGELGLVDSSRSTSTGLSAQSAVGNAISEAAKTDSIRNVGSNNNRQNNSAFKGQSSSQHRNASAQPSHSAGYNHQRSGGMAHRNSSGGEWSYRRTGYHNKNHSLGGEKGFPSTKVKQIYVAKQSTNGNSGSS